MDGQNYQQQLMHNTTIDSDRDQYRFKGNNMGIGKIVKGTLNQAPIKLKVSSIPNKYENIVYRSRSQPAFGDSTRKFYHPSQTKQSFNPGPGMYDSGVMFQNVSSKKGSGSFASSSKLARLERSRSHIPGPGSYQVKSKIGSIPTRKPSKSSSSSFMNTTAQSTALLSTKLQAQAHDLFKHEITESKKMPGPGFYQLAGNQQKMNRTLSLKSTFKSNVNRFIENKQEVPPVGQYEIQEKKLNFQKTKKIDNNAKKQVHQTDEERKKKLQKIISNSDQQKNKTLLGPGSYDPQIFTTTTKAFKIQDNMYDRFGNLKDIYAMAKNINLQGSTAPQTVDLTNLNAVANSKKTMTSMFKSTTKRSELLLQNKLGPCKYEGDKSPVKKSHHINFTQKWV